MPEKKNKNKPGSCVLISIAVKMLTTCAMQAIAGQIIQIDIGGCPDTIKLFPVSLFLKT